MVKVSGSISYAKGETRLTPDKLNTELPCRVMVENNTGQYSYQGRKFRFMLGEKQASGGSGKGGYKGGGYKKDTPDEVVSKCYFGLLVARINGLSISGQGIDTITAIEKNKLLLWAQECHQVSTGDRKTF